jgi:hypothetical protein
MSFGKKFDTKISIGMTLKEFEEIVINGIESDNNLHTNGVV